MGRIYANFREMADRRGRTVAIVSRDENLTFEDVLKAVDGAAAALAGKGVRRGQVVHTETADPTYGMIALLATNKLGASLLSARLDPAPRLTRRADIKLTDPAGAPEKRAGAIVMDKAWWADGASQRDVANVIDPDNLLYMFGTSGSTGRRKYIAVTERNLLNRISIANRYFIDGDTRLLCTIGASSMFATELNLTALLRGGSTVFLPLASETIPHYIDLFAITTLVTAPIVMSDLVKLAFPQKLYQTLRYATLSGGAASAKLLDGASRLVTPNLVLTCGNSEIGAVASMPYEADGFSPGRVGRPFDDLDVEIVDDDGEAVAPGTEGHIRMRRDNVIAEPDYLNADGAGGERFQDGWFYPGDLGHIDADGMLVISGRDDNVINIGGNKFSIDAIETEIEAKENCRCAVIRGNGGGQDDSETLTLVVSSEGKVAPRRIARFAGKRFPRLEFAAIYATEEIDLTESGKKDRLAIARRMSEHPERFTMVQ